MTHIERDVSLAPLTTLGLGGAAKRFTRVFELAELRQALHAAGDDPVLILGGGSNLVVRDTGFPGLVIQLAIDKMRLVSDRKTAVVSVSAGVVWDAFVAQMVGAGYAGLECMSGIPGLVGATPMQNVGAYGQEVSDTILFVRALDRETGDIVELDNAACELAYRTSRFRGTHAGRFVIVEVVFGLAQSRTSAPIKYPELSKALGIADGGVAPLAAVRDTVIRLRRGKGMVVDPGDPESRSAGSFFTNPIVDAATVAQLGTRVVATFPSWPAPGGHTKLAAGWLIERAGFAKGYTRGRVGISHKHALALVNRGGGTATELLDLAREIQEGVFDKLGIALHPEPIIVG
ncbi:MAG: UDP-N-acetylmuramate dehydrogenase [Deltaproteobacteria bacterium]|nr:UDP-N-acetylmuramate dehydrogenase [Deltaproteobacteria bacterium]